MDGQKESHVSVRVPAHQSPERLDKYLSGVLTDKSRAYIQSLIKSENVLVNGKPAKASYKITPDEILDIHLTEPPPSDLIPEDIPLNIVYEDDDLLVVDKPAGMVVHPAFGNLTGTLANALLFHYGENLSSVNSPNRPGIVHRLDKDTSGLLVVAKSNAAHARLAKQFAEKRAGRAYQAVLWGRLACKTSVIESFLIRDPKDRRKMISHAEEGKWAVTHLQVRRQFPLAALVELNLKTGRTHQIRVHSAKIGHPVLGDPIYGGRRKALNGLGQNDTAQAVKLLRIMKRQALHAWRLRFLHPRLEKDVEFRSPLPPDFQALLALLEASLPA